MWVGIALTVAFGVVGIATWRWPRSPKAVPAAEHEELRVEVSNHVPVFGHPDGSLSAGDHLVAVIARNGTDRRARATGWGIRIPDGRTLVVTTPTTMWEPRLPHWLQPGDEATWYLEANALREQAGALGCSYDDMRAFVHFADVREVQSDRGVPLA